ncbi:MAG: gamma-glutamyltransferase family protein [Clostridiales bacterium]|nr:gamma-glutamyltransferase family protein [Clostridiales bacterium]
MLDPAHMSDPHRPVYGKAMVSAGEPLVASAGLEALAAGGNAVDAALAMAAMSAVVMPEMCGLGGDAFVLVYEPDPSGKGGRVYSFAGSGPAPQAATLERFRNAGYDTLPPFRGWWSVAVPGAPAVYFALHQRFGRLPLAHLWRRAIAYARDGFPVSPRLAASIYTYREILRQHPGTAKTYLVSGEAPKPGALLRNPALAKSFEILLEDGPEAFYGGPLGESIARASKKEGGLLTVEDLEAFGKEAFAEGGPVLSPAIATSYRGYRIWLTPPPSQGHLLLQMLNILEGFDLTHYRPHDPDFIHLLVEAKKLAYADRLAYMGDPRFVRAPLEHLLSKSFAADRRRQIQMDRALDLPQPGHLPGDTTSFLAVDEEGRAVSFIHSISAAFGAAVMDEETGILLNNRAGRGFTLEEGHPNCLAPGKRTMHTLNTYLVTYGTEEETQEGSWGQRAGDLYALGNTPGGDGQPQWNLQALLHLLDLGLNPYEAVAAPRWTSWPGTDPHTLQNALELWLESRFPPETAAELSRRGHRVRLLGPWAGGGSAHLIRRLSDSWEGAADPRDGGQAQAL